MRKMRLFTRHLQVQELFERLDRLQTTTAREAIARLLNDDRFGEEGRLERFGFRAYSQSDEDGIIAQIFARIGATNRRFVELGAGDGSENNTRYLLSQGWTGVWIEADKKLSGVIRRELDVPIAASTLRFTQAFVTRENLNRLIADAGMAGEIDLLSIDVDGNDYYLWEALIAVQPRVVVIEYNATFRPPLRRVQRYDPHAIWSGGNAFGASLSALEYLGKRLSYQLVATGLLGINAFFVRNDLCANHFVKEPDARTLFNAPAYDLLLGFGGGHRATWQSLVDPTV